MNKLAPYGTDGRLCATDVLPSLKSRGTKTMINIKIPARSNFDIVP